MTGNADIEDLFAAMRAGNRQESLRILGEIGTLALEPLAEVLRANESVMLRSAAAGLLGDLGDIRAVPFLVDALERDAAPEVRLWTADSLGVLGDARAVEPLITALGDHDPGVRETAVRALGALAEALGSLRALAALAPVVHDSDWGTRQSAAEMLIRLGAAAQADAEALLIADLQADDAEIRLGAAWSLVELGDTQALDPLVRLLYHPDNRIAAAAAHGLGQLGDARAVVPLNAALGHADEAVREAAQDALRRLDGD
jgi:HEAT repeat protein